MSYLGKLNPSVGGGLGGLPERSEVTGDARVSNTYMDLTVYQQSEWFDCVNNTLVDIPITISNFNNLYIDFLITVPDAEDYSYSQTAFKGHFPFVDKEMAVSRNGTGDTYEIVSLSNQIRINFSGTYTIKVRITEFEDSNFVAYEEFSQSDYTVNSHNLPITLNTTVTDPSKTILTVGSEYDATYAANCDCPMSANAIAFQNVYSPAIILKDRSTDLARGNSIRLIDANTAVINAVYSNVSTAWFSIRQLA